MNLCRMAAVGLGLVFLVALPLPRARGEDVFGYGAALDEALKKTGQLSPADFARRFPAKAEYLAGLSWDPTTGKFFHQFQEPPRGRFDFRLNEDELAAFKKNGFVVSERMGAASFAQMLYHVYGRDLPVYVAPDPILHAWHRSYDAMLEELEQTYLFASLDEILSGMSAAVPAAGKAYGGGVLADGLKDADYFLAVGRSLLAGAPVKTHLDQDGRVKATLDACAGLHLQKFALFGRERAVDFSQFKVRGHYEATEQLRRYFKAMMWCGRIDLRVAGNPEESSVREMASAVVLHDLLQRAGKFEQWQQFDRLIQTFVGKTDSMTFAQLGAVLAKGGIKTARDVKDLEGLEKLQKDIVAGKTGFQQIAGDVAVSPFGPQKARLPHTFTVLGQKFVLDNWVTAQLSHPSCLEVAFAALGNDQVVPILTARLAQAGGRRVPPGPDYLRHLAAVRQVIDTQDPAAWDENLYVHWLATLHELSAPITDPKYPEVMRTKAWAMRTLNSQLGSWTQLRHDSLLYVKQSYTRMTFCDYPAGFVEARPDFWAHFAKMANRAAELIEKTPVPDRMALHWTRDAQAHHFRNFARQVEVLEGIARKELAQKELTREEAHFLRRAVEIQPGGRSGQPPRYTGWYFGLFYKGPKDADKWDPLVADVHTNVPDPTHGDPGSVLTQGVGNVDLLLVAIDSGKDRMVYAGPVFSHYEFEMPGVTRKSDSEWRKDLKEGRLPPRPPWTHGYLVPGTNPEAKTYHHDDDK
jgi:hypothetical protein